MAIAVPDVGPVPPTWWSAARPRLLDGVLVAAAVLTVGGLLSLVLRPEGREVLGTGVAGVVPWWVLLLAGVPTTAWAASHALSLARFGGAVRVAFDAAVLAFVLWAGLGSRLDDLCRDRACTPQEGTGALLAVGGWTVLAWLLGVAISESRRSEHSGVRVFNVTLAAVAGGCFLLTTVVLRWDLPAAALRELGAGSVGVRDLVGVGAAAVVYVAADLLVTAAHVALGEGVRVREVLEDVNALLASATAVGVLCSAVFAALMTLHNPWSLVLLLPVVWALLHAARVGTLASTEQERSTALYRAAEACQSAERPEQILDAVTTAAARSLHADVVLDGPPGPGDLGVTIRHGTGPLWLVARRRAGGQPYAEGDSDSLATLAAVAGQALARVESTERIRRAAEQDVLTGLSTRRVLLRAVDDAVRRRDGDEGPGGTAAGGGAAVSLVYCDVDDFKGVNDTYGHGAGDGVLVEVARRLRAQVRPQDVVARLGGDEFAVLLPGADEEVARDVRARILAAGDDPHRVADRALAVGVSVGCATWLPSDVPPVGATDWLLDEADRDMYAHKRARRHDMTPAPCRGDAPARST